jgi:hypothetical protein
MCFRHLHDVKKLRHREKTERRLCKLNKKAVEGHGESIHPKRIERRFDKVVFELTSHFKEWLVYGDSL